MFEESLRNGERERKKEIEIEMRNKVKESISFTCGRSVQGIRGMKEKKVQKINGIKSGCQYPKGKGIFTWVLEGRVQVSEREYHPLPPLPRRICDGAFFRAMEEEWRLFKNLARSNVSRLERQSRLPFLRAIWTPAERGSSLWARPGWAGRVCPWGVPILIPPDPKDPAWINPNVSSYPVARIAAAVFTEYLAKPNLVTATFDRWEILPSSPSQWPNFTPFFYNLWIYTHSHQAGVNHLCEKRIFRIGWNPERIFFFFCIFCAVIELSIFSSEGERKLSEDEKNRSIIPSALSSLSFLAENHLFV